MGRAGLIGFCGTGLANLSGACVTHYPQSLVQSDGWLRVGMNSGVGRLHWALGILQEEAWQGRLGVKSRPCRLGCRQHSGRRACGEHVGRAVFYISASLRRPTLGLSDLHAILPSSHVQLITLRACAITARRNDGCPPRLTRHAPSDTRVSVARLDATILHAPGNATCPAHTAIIRPSKMLQRGREQIKDRQPCVPGLTHLSQSSSASTISGTILSASGLANVSDGS